MQEKDANFCLVLLSERSERKGPQATESQLGCRSIYILSEHKSSEANTKA